MKIARWVARILAILMPVLFFLLVNVLVGRSLHYSAQIYEQSQFTEQERAEICDMLKFELAPGERISTRYMPGAMQAKGFLSVTVHGIVSEEDFLARLQTEREASDEGWYLFSTKEFYGSETSCVLSFNGDLAEFFIGGKMGSRIPGLTNVENFLYAYAQQTTGLFVSEHYWEIFQAAFWGGLTLELGCIIFLVVARLHKRKGKIP